MRFSSHKSLGVPGQRREEEIENEIEMSEGIMIDEIFGRERGPRSNNNNIHD
jgi:hypothetical protein